MLHQLAASFKAHAILFVVPLLFLATNEVLLGALADPQRATWKAMILSMATISLPAALVTLFFVRMFVYAFITRPPSPTAALIADTLRVLRSPRRFINGLPVLIAMVMFNKAMLDLKPSIPALVPFAWDEAFMKLDRALHLGRDPWLWLDGVLGLPFLTLAVNFVYCFWFLAMFTFWFWFAFQDRYSGAAHSLLPDLDADLVARRRAHGALFLFRRTGLLRRHRSRARSVRSAHGLPARRSTTPTRSGRSIPRTCCGRPTR